MSIQFEIDEGARLVRLSAVVRPSQEEWFAMIGSVCADPRYRPGFDFLFDRTAIVEVPTAAAVHAWVARHGRVMHENGNGRFAFVVSEPVVFGMLRMATVFAEEEGTTLGVFWTEDEALHWLGR